MIIVEGVGNEKYLLNRRHWISYTHISHTVSGNGEKSTPLFDWGKFIEREGKLYGRSKNQNPVR